MFVRFGKTIVRSSERQRGARETWEGARERDSGGGRDQHRTPAKPNPERLTGARRGAPLEREREREERGRERERAERGREGGRAAESAFLPSS